MSSTGDGSDGDLGAAKTQINANRSDAELRRDLRKKLDEDTWGRLIILVIVLGFIAYAAFF